MNARQKRCFVRKDERRRVDREGKKGVDCLFANMEIEGRKHLGLV
jgi:hypothetical protein